MRSVDAFMAGAFWLILVYLVVSNWTGANNILGTLGTSTATIIKTLQARG